MKTITLLAAFLAPLAASAGQMSLPPELVGVGLDQKLNQQVPSDLTFRDESGSTVVLGQYLTGKPVILTLVYYQCPMLCTLVLNGLVRSLRGIGLRPGRDFEIVTVSFDSKESAALAAEKKARYVERYGSPDAAQAWHFLTGDDSSIARLTTAVGFRYRFDSKTGQFVHPSAIVVLTPQGRVSRYFYGVDYPARDLRLGLVEASAGRIGSPVDRALLFCYHYDPATGKYGVVVWGLVRLLSCLVLGMLLVFLWKMFRRDRSVMPAKA
jgi:protein SCO1